MTTTLGRRWVFAGVSGLVLLVALPAVAAPPETEKVYRIGFVSPTSAGARNEAFVRGLKELGYVDGQNAKVEMRFAGGKPERLDGLVGELVKLKVDVLVVGGTIGAKAAMRATSNIPTVFAGSSDPVAGGIVSNLAHPGGNITGFSLAYGGQFAGKWLELLKQADPSVAQYAALWSSSNAAATQFVNELKTGAQSLNVRVEAHHASNLAELEEAFRSIAKSGAKGLIVAPSPFAATNRKKLVEFAASRKLPAIYFVESFVKSGGLMSYGPNIVDAYHQAAIYVDKILNFRSSSPPGSNWRSISKRPRRSGCGCRSRCCCGPIK